MTIQIPEDLARSLEGMAAGQRRTVEQLALESLRALLDTASRPPAFLQVLQHMPHPSSAPVDDFESAISAGRLPVNDSSVFGPPEDNYHRSGTAHR